MVGFANPVTIFTAHVALVNCITVNLNEYKMSQQYNLNAGPDAVMTTTIRY